MIKKIISGGQTGSDIGGLVGARRAGIATGGVAPKGWLTEKGPMPVLASYGLIEHVSSEYHARTIANIKRSDATIIFSKDLNSPGTIATIKALNLHNKSYIVLDPFSDNAIHAVSNFIAKHDPTILNIAGNRESVSPGINKKVAQIIERVFANNSSMSLQSDNNSDPEPAVV